MSIFFQFTSIHLMYLIKLFLREGYCFLDWIESTVFEYILVIFVINYVKLFHCTCQPARNLMLHTKARKTEFNM